MVNNVRKHLESSNGFIGITSQLQSMKRIKAYESTRPRFTKETMADFGHGTWNCHVLNVASVALVHLQGESGHRFASSEHWGSWLQHARTF